MDQWRFSAFSHESDPLVQTPNLDRFAESGARFTRMYATDPVCTPNRSCILTSRFPHQHGMTRNNLTLPPQEKCLAETFAATGYATDYIGKWHMDGAAYPGLEFDRFSNLPRLAYRPNVPEKLRDADPLKRELAGYCGLCETLDAVMGRLLRGLEELGLAEKDLGADRRCRS